jgi:hypothetical protein
VIVTAISMANSTPERDYGRQKFCKWAVLVGDCLNFTGKPAEDELHGFN